LWLDSRALFLGFCFCRWAVRYPVQALARISHVSHLWAVTACSVDATNPAIHSWIKLPDEQAFSSFERRRWKLLETVRGPSLYAVLGCTQSYVTRLRWGQQKE
jgi:hypothetical protein